MRITEAAHYLGISINTLKELAEDIMKILTCYSARYYGARGGRKKGSRKPKTEAESVVLAEIANTSGELDFGGIQ